MNIFHWTQIGDLGPVVNILAIFSNANTLTNMRIKRYHIKGNGCPLLISIFDQETENQKRKIMIRLEPRLQIGCFIIYNMRSGYVFCITVRTDISVGM